MPYPTVQETQETSVPTNFQLTLVGEILLVDNANQLVLSDGTRFPVAKTKLDLPPQPQAYRVIPSISSTGAIANLSIDSYTSPELEDSPTDRCFLIGRIVQLGKKTQLAQFKVKRPGAKTLKLMLSHARTDMKMGQLWQVEAVRMGDRLQIKRVRQLESESDGDINVTPPASRTDNRTDEEGNTASKCSGLQTKEPRFASRGLFVCKPLQVGSHPERYLTSDRYHCDPQS